MLFWKNQNDDGQQGNGLRLQKEAKELGRKLEGENDGKRRLTQ